MGYEVYYWEEDDCWYWNNKPTKITDDPNSKWFPTLKEAMIQCHLLNKWA